MQVLTYKHKRDLFMCAHMYGSRLVSKIPNMRRIVNNCLHMSFIVLCVFKYKLFTLY